MHGGRRGFDKVYDKVCDEVQRMADPIRMAAKGSILDRRAITVMSWA